MHPGLGRRVIVIGASCSGKSTLGERLSQRLGVAHIELDALYWQPNWQHPEVETFREHVAAAVGQPGWVVSGSYLRQQQDVSWPLAESVVWIDLPLRVTVPRLVGRTWRRSRRNDVLWGSNRETFWRHLKLWDEEASLIAYTVRHDRERRERYLRCMADPRWAHLRFFRLCSQREVDGWLARVSPIDASVDLAEGIVVGS
jgi:adenylate kinase family enzyme